jgi:hypothetical protein
MLMAGAGSSGGNNADDDCDELRSAEEPRKRANKHSS